MSESTELMKMPSPQGAPVRVLHESLMPVRWGDMDALQHMNNTVYFRFMEQCRIECLEKFGLLALDDDDVVPVLVAANCRFIKAITYPATVRVTIGAIGASGRALDTWHELWVADELCATGLCTLVWMSRVANKAVPIPEVALARLGVAIAPRE